VYTDIVLAIKPEFAKAICTKKKNHEYQKYKIEPTVTRFWLYETEPINAIQYVISIGSTKTPEQVQDSTGLENDDFDKGLKESYGYSIYRMWQLKEPLYGPLMKELIGISPPHWYKYTITKLISQHFIKSMRQIFCSQKFDSQAIHQSQVYAT